MTTLIRKIATNITSSLILFFVSISNNQKKITNFVTDVTGMLHFAVTKNLANHNGYETAGFNLFTHLTQVVKVTLFEISLGNPIIGRNVKNDKNKSN
jgi:hypothetical protein